MIGQIFAQYEILGKLGQGGIGQVYLARDNILQRDVALKVLSAELRDDPDARERFLEEARASAALEHPFICHIHEAGQAEGIAFIAMEKVEGHSLRAELGRGPISLPNALRIAAEIAEALGEAHRREIVHRDLNPSNVMLTTAGHVKVMDFGLAKRVSTAEQSQVETLTAMTMKDGLAGTVPYMSPEQLTDQTVDARSDIFSLGVMLYEMITGRHPFLGTTPDDTARSILKGSPAPLAKSLAVVPGGLQELIDELLAVDNQRRADSAESVRDRLRSIRRGVRATRTPKARRPKRLFIGGTAVVLLLAGFGVVHTWRGNQAKQLIPHLETLAQDGNYREAFRLAAELEKKLPGNRKLQLLMPTISNRLTVHSDPDGASVFVARLPENASDAIQKSLIGTTPVVHHELARGEYKIWVEKAGFATAERLVSRQLNHDEAVVDADHHVVATVPLQASSMSRIDMLFVTGGVCQPVGFGELGPVALEDFYIDKYEVSNRQYREFVRDGGYDNAAYWAYPIFKSGVELTYEQAMQLFTDRSGKPGPRGWDHQEYPPGKDDHPVTGITWFEAAAYAEYVSKTLPTVYQWEWAACSGRNAHSGGRVMPWGTASGSLSALRANMGGRDTAPVDTAPFGISPFGAYNMAGNAAEWCINERGDGRVTAGGAWSDAESAFTAGAVHPALEALNTIGFRCVSRPTAEAGDQGSRRIDPERSAMLGAAPENGR